MDAESIYQRLRELGVDGYDMRQPVYKYRDITRAKEIIEKNELYFASAVELKDKLELHESLLDFSYTNEVKEKYLDGLFERAGQTRLEVSDEEFTGLITNSINFFKNGIGIFSTSKSAVNNFLWENYGDNHKGICLGFKVPDNAFLLAFNINYTAAPRRIKFFDEQEFDLANDIYYWFCTKDKSYLSEDEVRLINENAKGPRPFNKELLYEIVFGTDTTDEDQELILDLIKKHNYPVRRIGKAKISNERFGLQLEYTEI